MDHQALEGSPGLKKDRNNAQQGRNSQDAQISAAQPPAQVNGAADQSQTGAQLNAVAAPTRDTTMANGSYSEGSTDAAESSSMPVLDQSWRQGPSNKSMGTLVDRLAQQCYHDLNKTLQDMAEIGDSQDAPQANGVLASGPQDTSQASIEKKQMLMTFASDQRDRFTKMLVLTDWSRNEEEMARLIDVKVWQDAQRAAYANAAHSIGEIKRAMMDFKVPAPNIEGAMELLASGKASWIPDLGYIPPKRLTATQLLKTLEDMNVALATRLNLHDELPPYMRDFDVANGRATFSVPTEFEVDLSVADEDPSSPFYFIDLRFLFTPSSDGLNEQLRAHIEPRVNAALAKDGLKGCYDFLHNFVLTHKIVILADQARQLVRYGKWVDCVKCEHLRRVLTVQYWTTMKGPKHWFEIGIESGKQKLGSRRRPTPKLSVRWFRKGNEVRDEELDFDWKTLDIEACLLHVIGKHCLGKLSAVQGGIKALAANSQALDVQMTEPSTPIEDCKLTIGMPAIGAPLTVRIERITGRVNMSPPCTATLQREQALNTDPSADIPRVLALLVCQILQEQVRKQAEVLDWQEVRTPTTSRAKFGTDVWQRSVFLVPGWGPKWALAVSFGLVGEKWWVARLTDFQPGERTQAMRDVDSLRRIGVEGTSSLNPTVQAGVYSRELLLRIERAAVAEVSYSVLSKELGDLKILHHSELHHAENESTSLTDHVSSVKKPSWIVSAPTFVQFAPLMQPRRDKLWKPWAATFIRSTQHAIRISKSPAADQSGSIRHDIRLSLESGKFKTLQKALSRARDIGIAFNTTGGLALQLRTPFGEPFLKHIQKRLRSIERLDGYVTILQALGFTCTTVTPARLAFSYSSAPHLSAQLFFAADGGLPVRLKLQPADSNPHLRIQISLEQGLNSAEPRAFETFAHLLPFTLPFLQATDRLEAAHLSGRSFAVRVRSSTWYSLSFKAPLPTMKFDALVRNERKGKNNSVKWHLTESSLGGGNGSTTTEALAEALKTLYRARSDRWQGINNSVVADSVGMGMVLEKLNELMESLESAKETNDLPTQGTPALASASITAATAPTQAGKQGQQHQAPLSTQGPAREQGTGRKQGQKQDVIELD
ncbi:hypothetical protein B0A50_01422 [Salinomyces thailandicus]|uniref:Mediator of RNA polymerase II transcription subunit 14 n=1 Tax=Salinomyces thailandicus TaxID=706561 RepID=A0A4U0UAE4_9PEZI|nr:hypothetical protein B0A50_01422 [Salinomyces thailandica]